MFKAINKALFGSFSDKELKRYRLSVDKINRIESEFESMDDAACLAKSKELQERVQEGGESLDSVLPEAFSLVRRAAQNTLGQRHFDVQLIGALALHHGQIAEMKTGEGKTLTATAAVYLNALSGKGVHVITVNDYLATRDAEWMGEIYRYLGMTVGVIVNGLNDDERRKAYAADITYGTNNEFGFDYLRDNMKFHLDDYVQREHNFAIVDEVDSILIDEARTPLIISGPTEDSTELYYKVNKELYGLTRALRISDSPEHDAIAKAQDIPIEKVPSFLREFEEDLHVVVPGDFTLEEKTRNIQLTEQGVEKMERRLADLMKTDNLYDFENIDVLHHVTQALKAHYVFKRDVDYVVQGGKVLIVDEFTGRLMEGRRFSDGLHQALEAKENVRIENENQTLASITFQNYFRKYKKLAGMTGTAKTEEAEFKKIYNLGVIVIPTNVPVVRVDNPDVILKTGAAKFRAIIIDIKRLHEKGQPVLVGTANVDSSEKLSAMLKKEGIPHSVLNAKYHDKEAQIIQDAGKRGAVTIATNMAGRGTDIKVAKAEMELGGLFILGTERHESRRIDNQLRGRSGRQGDPGESRFYLSLEDDLLRIFGGDRIANIMNKLNIDEDEAIEHVLVSRAIENSQKKVEAYNFDVRKHLLEYDDVMNKQREIIYERRRRILGNEGEIIFFNMIEEEVERLIDLHCNEKFMDQWDTDTYVSELYNLFHEKFKWQDTDAPESAVLADWTHERVKEIYGKKKAEFGEYFDDVMRHILLELTDTRWKDHLLQMDHLKEGIGMRSYAQKNPLTEYKKEAFDLFSDLMDRINAEAVRAFFHVSVVHEPINEMERQQQEMEFIHNSPGAPAAVPKEPEPPKAVPVRKQHTPGRNDPCYCGSGKKYKNCHMKQDQAEEVI